MQNKHESQSIPSNVFDLATFRSKKNLQENLSGQNRQPLYVSHIDGKLSGSPHMKSPADTKENGFADRLTRIKSSLEKINRLMSEIKSNTGAPAQKDSPISILSKKT